MTKREWEITDINEMIRILDTAKVLHLGLIDGDMPYIVPMNYGYTMEDGKLTIYMHSSVKGHKLDVIRQNPKCCFELECDVHPFEGRMPCQYGTTYYSLMGRGEVELIEDSEAKQTAMSLFMKTQTGKDFEFNDKLVSVVTLMKINVSEYSAKHRPLPAVHREAQ